MVNDNSRLRAVTTGALAALAVLTACGDQNNEPAAPDAVLPAPSDATLELRYSPVQDGRVTVALGVGRQARDPIASVQAQLRFDPTALEFEGQDVSDRVAAVTSLKHVATGALRVAAFDVDGFDDRAATYTFRVKRPDFASSLAVEVQEVTSKSLRTVRVAAPRTVQSSGLPAPVARGPLALRDWVELLDPSAAKLVSTDNRILSLNGDRTLNLQFGNVLIDAAISTGDALAVAQIAVTVADIDDDEDLADGTKRDPAIAGNVLPLGNPGVLDRVGIEPDGQRLLTSGDALAIAQFASGLVNPTSAVGQVMPDREAQPTGATTVVSGTLTGTPNWTRNNVYELDGTVKIGEDCSDASNGNIIVGCTVQTATLTIQPGTEIRGRSAGAIFVSRAGRIIADGLPSAPIRFTCTAAEGAKGKGCWRGLYIAGNAPINEPNNTGIGTTCPAIPGRTAGGTCRQDQGEGNALMYGGNEPADNSGILRYIIVEYGGFAIAANSELNNLTLAGVGSGTIVENVQTHAGLDDGFEVFGGTFDAKRLYLTANSDDQLDWTQGWAGRVQYVVVQQDPADSDNGIEGDNAQRSANRGSFTFGRTNPKVYNFTFVGPNGPSAGELTERKWQGMHIRRGSAGQLFNGIMTGWNVVIDLDDVSSNTCVDINTATGFQMKSVAFFNNTALGRFTGDLGSGTEPSICGPYNASVPGGGLPVPTDVGELMIRDAANNNLLNPAGLSLRLPYDKLNPDFRPLSNITGVTPPNDGFFEQVSYLGATDAQGFFIPFYEGWTKGWQNSSTP